MTHSERIQAIRERLRAATPGPWKIDDQYRESSKDAVTLSPGYWFSPGHYPRCLEIERGEGFAIKDAELIANAPDDLEYLLTALGVAVERLEKLRDRGCCNVCASCPACDAKSTLQKIEGMK